MVKNLTGLIRNKDEREPQMPLSQAQLLLLDQQQAGVNAAVNALAYTIATLTADSVIQPPPPVVNIFAGPNLPSGLPVISIYDFHEQIPGSQGDVALSDSWHSIYNGQDNVTSVIDSTLGHSVLQVKYPGGFVAGSAPGTLYRPLPNVSKLYCAFRVKVSVPWQGNPDNVNKLVYFFAGNAGSMPIVFYGTPGGPYHLRVFPQFVGVGNDAWLIPNLDQTPFPVDNQYHLIEFYADHSGVVAWALDGKIQGNYSNIAMPAAMFSEFHLTPVWGGVEGVKTETDFITFNGMYLAGA